MLSNDMKRIIKESLPKNDQVIFEFGSRFGEDTVSIAKNFPNACIYAFECNPNTVETCRKNCAQYSNIILTEKAISNKDGVIDFFPVDIDASICSNEAAAHGSSSLLKLDYDKKTAQILNANFVQQNVVTVKTTTLKNFMDEHKINRIDFMWMDIQGAEMMALEGLGEDIDKVTTIYTEVNFRQMYAGQSFFKDINKFLIDRNFILAGFKDYYKTHANAIYVNKKSENIIKNIKKCCDSRNINIIAAEYIYIFTLTQIKQYIKKCLFTFLGEEKGEKTIKIIKNLYK